MRAFTIEGVDLESGTVVIEIERAMLCRIAPLLEEAIPVPRNNIHLALRRLGERLRDAAAVLYGKKSAKSLGFALLDPPDETEVDETEPNREFLRTGS